MAEVDFNAFLRCNSVFAVSMRLSRTYPTPVIIAFNGSFNPAV
ncbi:MAG: hypothetical protein MRT15_02175 [archaeon YNP-LCB-003-016]|nr:hypothetical protein [Candidatus Culexarchaeum yellowstonense]